MLLFVLLLIGAPSSSSSFTGRVVGVVDGDTIKVMRAGQAVTVRLAEIDCPEKTQAFGQAAKTMTSSLTFSQDVTVTSQGTDRYGRLIGTVVRTDGLEVNRVLVAQGYAWWYQAYSHDAGLGLLQAQAQLAHLGLWHEASPTPPWLYRKQHAAHR